MARRERRVGSRRFVSVGYSLWLGVVWHMRAKNKKNSSNVFVKLVLVCVVFFGVFALGGPLSTSVEKDEGQEVSCSTSDFSGDFDPSEKIAVFEGKEIPAPSLVASAPKRILGTSFGERWIEIDLSEQKLKAWEEESLFLETLISSGLPQTPTPIGEFHIWTKLRATKMEGGSGKSFYSLPNVPYVMFFEGRGIPNWKGYGLHGTYWHSDFGNRRSHGCVNLPTSVAEQLYNWVTPVLPEGKNSIRATDANPGTRIVIHE